MKNKYLAKRQELLNNAQAKLNEGNFEEVQRLKAEIEKLDNDYRQFATEQANLEALTNKNENFSVSAQLGTASPLNTSTNPPKMEDVCETTAYKNAWLKNLQGKELSSEDRQVLSNAQAGVIPTQTFNKIVSTLEEAPLYKAVDVTYIPGNISIPVETDVDDAQWIEMKTPSTDSKADTAPVTLSAYKLIKTIAIDADIKNMSISAFEQWLVARLANKIERAANSAIVVGTGTNQATGILKDSGVKTKVQYTNKGITYKDLTTILGKLPSSYHKNAKWAMPTELFFGEILSMTDTTGRPIITLDPTAPCKYKLLGMDVILEDAITKDNIILGDFSKYSFNWAKNPIVESDSSVEFRKGSTVYRAMGLADGKPVDKKAFVIATRAIA